MRLSAIAGVLSSESHGFGEIAVDDIPEKLVCPQCGAEASDGGECLVRFEYLANPNRDERLVERSPAILMVVADCRTCGYYGPGPTSQSFFKGLEPASDCCHGCFETRPCSCERFQ